MTENGTGTTMQSSEEHRELLQSVFASASEQIVIASPYISYNVLAKENLLELVEQAVGRGVTVRVFVDSEANCYAPENMRESALQGIVELHSAGARVGVVAGLQEKVLARDNDLIAEGSFNWLSAPGIRSWACRLKEPTIVTTGTQVPEKISQVVGRIETTGYGLVSYQENSPVEVTKAGRVIGLLCMLVLPGLIGNDLGHLQAGIVSSVVMLCCAALWYGLKFYRIRQAAPIHQS